MKLDAIVLLGCRIGLFGRPSSTAARRADRAAQAWHDGIAPLIVVSGGRRWHGVAEADALADYLVNRCGVPADAVLRECRSLCTAENARYSARLLRDRRLTEIGVVTSDWHIARAVGAFRRAGLTCEPLPALSPPARHWVRAYLWVREAVSHRLDGLRGVIGVLGVGLVAALSACGRSGAAPAPSATGRAPVRAGPSAPPNRSLGTSAPSSASLRAGPAARINDLIEAEYRRDSGTITEDDLGHHDPAVRRAAARALSQIFDDRSVGLLGRALGDEDPTVVGWAAYGLGAACHTRESKTVRALAMRAASLVARPPVGSEPGIFDLDSVLADALARCASSEAEATLRAWLGGPRRRADTAAMALGRVAAQNARLDDASVVALLDAAARGDRPLDYALYPLTRLGGLGEPVEERLAAVLGSALDARGPRRAFALRALGKTGPRGAERLGAIVTDRGFSPTERANAARELGGLGEAGQTALARALEGLVPRDGRWEKLLGPEFGPLLAALETLGTEGARRARPVAELAVLPVSADTSPALRRRLVRLRCRAAALLAGHSIQHPKLVACDPDPQGRLGALARIAVLGKSEIRGAGLVKWRTWAASRDPVVRQAALGLMPGHPEILRSAEVLAEALKAKEDGTVATAAQVLGAYPDRASAEPRARSDPASGLKPAAPLVAALTEALAAKRPADALQRSAALIDAVGALGLLSLKPVVADACTQANAALRLHAEKSLRLLGEVSRQCDRGSLPRGIRFERYPSGRRPRLKLFTDAGLRELVLDPTWAPVAVRRVVDLARAGFYNGTIVHRVIPGFVVQFGDPGGDGYGGAGRQPLPSETAPLIRGEHAVGLAAAGRDTGSSQLFVTLGAYPHLEGDFAWIGSADPGWDAVAEGDFVERVEVVE